MPGRYAVVIGINYRNFPVTMDQEVQSRAGINALNYAEADAEEMAEQLNADGYDVAKLVGPAATRVAIINALRTQSRNAGPEGLLLVHYSGHGALDPDDRELAYLLPADADPQEMAISAIALNDVASRRLLGQTRSALVLLDCCHSGYAVDFKSGDKDVVLSSEAQAFSQQAGLTFRGVSGRVIIAACGGQQLARERGDLKHGVLTYYVLEHWRNSSKSVNDINLYDYLAERMRPQQGVPDPVRGGSAQQGVIELRPARTNNDHTRPTQIPEPASNVPRLSPSDRATLFRLILEIVQTPTDFFDLTFYIDLEFKANSQDADLRSMIRSFIKQAEGANRIPELREAIEQFRADQQVNNPTPSGADMASTAGIQGNTSDGSVNEPRTASEANTHVQRGKDYFENHLYEQALAEYNRAIKLDPKLASAYNGRGLVYYIQNDYKRALAEYNRAIELDPKAAAAYSNRGNVYRNQGDYKRALAEYNRAIELDPKFAIAYSNRGNVYRNQGDYERALVEHGQAIELDPKLGLAYNNRGYVYYMQGDYERALADFGQAIELDPKLGLAYNNRGNVYCMGGDYERALAEYDRAIELEPKLAWAYHNRGQVYDIQEDYKRALVEFDQAIELDPENRATHTARAEVYAKLQQQQ